MIKIIYTRPDGGVSITTPVSKEQIEKNRGTSITDKEYNSIIQATIPLEATDITYVNSITIPEDRTFRAAWKIIEGTISICTDSCRYIIREVRNAKLKMLDIKYIAESRKPTGDVQSIELKAKLLRDVSIDVRFNGTVEELKKLLVEVKNV